MNTSRIRTALMVATAATSLTLTACSSTSGTTTAASSSTASATTTAVATTTSATAAPTTTSSMAGMPMPSAPAGPHNAADITFASMMLVHHKGAIAMAELAPARASSAQVKALAAKIKAEQAPEITLMTGWLSAWQPATDMNGKPMTTTSSMAMGSMGGMASGSGMTTAAMPGMMSDQQMAQLTAAKGAAFDKTFLTMMIAHHKGAVEMANTEKSGGSSPEALALAQSIVTSQTAEITTMQDLLKTL